MSRSSLTWSTERTSTLAGLGPTARKPSPRPSIMPGVGGRAEHPLGGNGAHRYG